ncbi:Gti1/Pac2 family-domain-containing protein [Coniochaeta sp. 2T2.1]|nr:Gti1/Pac2 family-domain-containing protein [Coniochaeta sp. 2T2.1]
MFWLFLLHLLMLQSSQPRNITPVQVHVCEIKITLTRHETHRTIAASVVSWVLTGTYPWENTMNPQLADNKGNGSPVGMPEILQPTYFGFVRTAKDACVLLEMLLSGRLPHVQRRPHERERADIVKSGNVFIYEESISGVRRWTDGVNWSPSRILGNFLIYREVKQGYPGEGGKKTAIKKKPRSNGGVKKRSAETRSGLINLPITYAATNGSNDANRMGLRTCTGRWLTRTRLSTMAWLRRRSLTVAHHLVSYYKAEDVLSGKLKPVRCKGWPRTAWTPWTMGRTSSRTITASSKIHSSRTT